MCFHHPLIHEGGARVEALPDGGFRYFWPNGTEVVAVPPRPKLEATEAWRMAARFVPKGVEIGPDTGRPTWMGERADYDFMADVLRTPDAQPWPLFFGPQRVEGHEELASR